MQTLAVDNTSGSINTVGGGHTTPTSAPDVHCTQPEIQTVQCTKVQKSFNWKEMLRTAGVFQPIFLPFRLFTPLWMGNSVTASRLRGKGLSCLRNTFGLHSLCAQYFPPF